jgi:hypothetical protein
MKDSHNDNTHQHTPPNQLLALPYQDHPSTIVMDTRSTMKRNADQRLPDSLFDKTSSDHIGKMRI